MTREFHAAVERLKLHLRRAGAPGFAADASAAFYAHALVAGGEEAWRAFYRSIHRRLSELAAGGYPATGDVAPLLALLDDDLGAMLYRAVERERIRRALVESSRRRETRLSS